MPELYLFWKDDEKCEVRIQHACEMRGANTRPTGEADWFVSSHLLLSFSVIDLIQISY
jgi:hypothetical protein